MKNTFKNIILLGEIHGTEGNLWALQTLIDELDIEYSKITIALELPTSWNSALLKLSNGNEVRLLELMADSEELLSGRISKTHIDKYLELAKQGVVFVAIRDNHDDWNTTDKAMAQNILEVSKDRNIVIATLGNLHTERTESVVTWGGEYTCHPTGELLKEVATTVLIRYANTKYINFGVIGETVDTECGFAGIIKSDTGSHDYSICIRDSGIA